MAEVKEGPTARRAQAKHDGRPDAQALLDAALSLMAEEGLGGLTLRPLARRLGYPVATFARQAGSKDQLFDHLIGLAARADEADLLPWLRFVESYERLPRDALIDITEEVLRMRSGSGKLRSHFKCELIQAAAFNERLRPALANWICIDHRFWRALAFRAEPSHSFDMAAALDAFAIDDAARALIMDDHDSYRWLRREAIRRLWNGLFDGTHEPNALYERAIGDTPAPCWEARTLTSERDKRFGAIVVEIILDGGTDAITHREVARRADMPHSSVAYHYPLQDDLVELGMHMIVEMVQKGAAAAMSGRELPVESSQFGYASFAIALAAARRPNLRPIVREMRRRRGENLLPWLRRNAPGDERIDFANVQTMSSVLIGGVLFDRAGIKRSAPLARQLFAQLGEWPNLLVRFGD